MESLSFVIFGPQTEWPSKDCISHLRHDLLTTPELLSFKEAVRSLPDLWPLLLEIEPRLEHTNTHEAFITLAQWLDFDFLQETQAVPLGNALLSPLTVILHTVQYVKRILQSELKSPDTEDTPSYSLEGMCTGFLTAIAASLSESMEELSSNASVVLRLAACVGALIDLNGGYADSGEKVRALVVQWETELEQAAFLHTMTSHPKAYVSVRKDATGSTIVVPILEIDTITQRLSSYGLRVLPLTLTGRYHHPSNLDAARNMIQLCQARPDLQFPESSVLHIPLRAGDDCQVVSKGCVLHELVIKTMLLDQVNWQGKITAALEQPKNSGLTDLSFIVIGLSNCVPRRIDGWRISNMVHLSEEIHQFRLSLPQPESSNTLSTKYPMVAPTMNLENAVAIVGMACRFPGAESLDEFWTLLQEGTSMLSDTPAHRFNADELRRSAKGTHFWGNFLSSAEMFDRQFFKISSREASSMDPQQRLLLQVAYEAIQSAQYFDGQNQTKEFGCYIGVGSVDYQDNIYSHQPTAYSAVGSLRAFLSGRISHYFGWTGPAITFDTACSSSLVALHSACKALLAGECNAALAGGVNVITSPALYQNLGAASFLSPSGASKAFDSAADGYCRGEGCGLVVLKRLSDAIDAGDHILSVIAGSAINQSDNSVSITVPHSESQSTLYRRVLSQTGLAATDVSYVEAHGTGTPVGDPIECQSIRNVFGGAHRNSTVHIGSVKGNIGHLEAASGIAALIKSVLMIQNGIIPKQASFVSLNPRIPPLEPDNMAIPMKTTPWDSEYRAICINNYGASGTNGALVVCQPPAFEEQGAKANQMAQQSFHRHLISLSANSITSLQAYCLRLQEQISSDSESKIADYVFNLAHQQDFNLKYHLSGTVESLNQLQHLLTGWQHDIHQSVQQAHTDRRPIVLCFGGHSGPVIGLDKEIYDNMSLFRFHLDNVNETLNRINGHTIFPHIFSKHPIADSVALHCSLFALQYASAMSWIDSGVIIDTVIGHSFGQITAMCISGVLSLRDALIFVSGRAAIFEKRWPVDKGAMVAVRTDLDSVLDILKDVHEPLDIACCNGPSDIVVAGSTPGIKAFENVAATTGIQTQRLDTERAFHSRLMNDALPDLVELASKLTFKSPRIHIETCTRGQNSWSSFIFERLVEHSRQPVYFNDAVQRIQQRLGSCIWLEAGSRSVVTKLASRCVHGIQDIFLPVDLSPGHSENSLIQTTMRIRDCGYHVQYWPYHRKQRYSYKHINLPPYQFDKSSYWLEFKDFSENSDNLKKDSTTKYNSEILQFLKYGDTKDQNTAVFAVNIACDSFQAAVSGHAVMGNSLCPASLYIELAARAASHLNSSNSSISFLSQVTDLQILSPLGLDTTPSVQLVLTRSHPTNNSWSFSLISTRGDQETKHASGTVNLQTINDHYLHAKRETLERFVGAGRCNTLLHDRQAESMQGPLVYRVFESVVNYKSYYQGVMQIAAKGSETAGIVSMPESSAHIFSKKTVTEPLLADNFLQVAGIHVNCLRDIPKDEIYICTFTCEMQIFDIIDSRTAKSRSWVVYVYTKQESEKVLESDILAFDQESGFLSMALQGVKFSRVNIKSLARSLSAVNPKSTHTIPNISPIPDNLFVNEFKRENPLPVILQDSTPMQAQKTPQVSILKVKELLSSLTDTSPESIEEDVTLDMLGIDSLMVTELVSEIRKVFDIDVKQNEIGLHSTVSALSNYLMSKTEFSTSHLPVHTEKSTTSSTQIDVASFLGNIVDIPVNEIRNESSMDELGIDSLMETEVLSEIRTLFGVTIAAGEFRQLSVARLSELLNSDKRAAGPPSETDLGSITTDEMAFATPASSASSLSSLLMKPNVSSSATTIATPLALDKLISNGVNKSDNNSSNDIHEVFTLVKNDFDGFAAQTRFTDFYLDVYPRQMELVTSYIVEAFDKMGYSLASFPKGTAIPAITHIPKHDKLVPHLYSILETAGIISKSETGYKRTRQTINVGQSSQLLDSILREFPQHVNEHKLLSLTGPHLADCLRGTTDAINLIFGSRETKDLLSNVYLEAPMFATGTKVLCKFLSDAIQAFNRESPSRTIRILEIGAGTGGTTKKVISTLCASNVPFEYTFTDISVSLVAAAKKTFASYKQMDFTVLDIEQEPSPELTGKYDIVISTNCIHATRNLVATTTNIHKLLNKTGILCLVELTRNLFWFDLVFGLLEGWWLFNDGRKHALASEAFWKESLMTAGYSSVDWTGSHSKESELLRLIVAFKEPKPLSRMAISGSTAENASKSNLLIGHPSKTLYSPGNHGSVVLLTGATGNLGTHVLQNLLGRDEVQQVICLNRPAWEDCVERQLNALEKRGIQISPDCWSNKIQIIETKTERPNLGLGLEVYNSLCNTVTHIVHNAWPMSFRRPLDSFGPQFETMKHILKFIRDIQKTQQKQQKPPTNPRLIFISSIGVVGHHLNIQSRKPIPEAPVLRTDSVSLSMGYAQAKLICEEMIQHAVEDKSGNGIEACFARVGQMTGSRKNGVWNSDEHFPALVKASQVISAFPQLEGTASWLPVEVAAATVSEILLDPRPPKLVYHIENPARQPWSELIDRFIQPVLGDTKNGMSIIPYTDWIEQVKNAPESPILVLIEFFEKHFIRMDCGGVILDTTLAQSISPSLRTATPVDIKTVSLYVRNWKQTGFLK